MSLNGDTTMRPYHSTNKFLINGPNSPFFNLLSVQSTNERKNQSSIQCQDLNPQLLSSHASPPLTTRPENDVIDKFLIRVDTILGSNVLVKTSYVACNIQSECFI